MTSAPAPRTRAELLRGPAIVGASGLAAATLLRLRDPHVAGSYGYCPFLALTGHACAGCGGLRAVNDLTHGDIVGAAGSNVLAVALVAVVGVMWLVWTVRRWQGDDRPPIRLTERGGLVVLGVFVVFAIVRNNPWGAALGP